MNERGNKEEKNEQKRNYELWKEERTKKGEREERK